MFSAVTDHRGLAHERLGDRRGTRRVARRRRRTPTPRSARRPGRARRCVEHVDELVLDHLVRGDRLVELHARLRRTRSPSRARRRTTPTSSAASATAVSSATRAPDRGVVAGRTDRRRPACSSSTRRPTLRVGSIVGDRRRCRAPRCRNEPMPSCVRATTRTQSAVWPSSTIGFSAAEHPRRRPCAAARVRTRSTGSPWPDSSSATVPRVAPSASRASRSVAPSRRGRERRRAPTTRRTGPGTGPGPSPRARRPCRRGRGRGRRAPRARAAPVQPRSTICRQTLVGRSRARRRPSPARRSRGDRSARNARTDSRSASWSSENVKSMRSRTLVADET